MKQTFVSIILAISFTFIMSVVVSCVNLGLNKACERLGHEMNYPWKYENGCYLEKNGKWIKQ